MLPQLGLLPPLGHKKAICKYPWVSHSLKTGGLVTFVHCSVHRQTNTGLYNIDDVNTVKLGDKELFGHPKNYP